MMEPDPRSVENDDEFADDVVPSSQLEYLVMLAF